MLKTEILELIISDIFVFEHAAGFDNPDGGCPRARL